jgi:bacillithiol biosynthesis deacetylase BshB1
MTKYPTVDLMAIGAHPDDVEVGCGGLLIKMAERGYRTGIVYLTRGEMGTGGTPEIREQEARHAADILGAKILATLDCGDCRVADNYDNRLAVAQLLRHHQPKIVLAPYWTGGHGKRQSHPDHLATGQIAINAAYYATFKKLPIDGNPYRIRAVYHYFLPPEVPPTFVVDITAQFDKWMEALKAHKSQFMNPEKNRDYLWSLESMARSYGGIIGVKYGQGYAIGEPLKIDDIFCLVGTCGGSHHSDKRTPEI